MLANTWSTLIGPRRFKIALWASGNCGMSQDEFVHFGSPVAVAVAVAVMLHDDGV